MNYAKSPCPPSPGTSDLLLTHGRLKGHGEGSVLLFCVWFSRKPWRAPQIPEENNGYYGFAACQGEAESVIDLFLANALAAQIDVPIYQVKQATFQQLGGEIRKVTPLISPQSKWKCFPCSCQMQIQIVVLVTFWWQCPLGSWVLLPKLTRRRKSFRRAKDLSVGGVGWTGQLGRFWREGRASWLGSCLC